jgi:hypothetical protein
MKLIPLIVSVTVLTAPMAVHIAQAQSAQTIQLFPALAGVNLSQTQQTQFEQLRQQTRSQIDAVVSPQQQQNFFNALQKGQELRGAIAAANLSGPQRTQVRGILQTARQQAAAILTVQQRQQILQNLRSKWLGQS